MVKRWGLSFCILLLLVTLMGCGKPQVENEGEQTRKESGMETFAAVQTKAVIETLTLATMEDSSIAQTEVVVDISNVPAKGAMEVESTEAVKAGLIESTTEAVTEAVTIPNVVVPAEVPVVTNGKTYGYYTNCTNVGLIQDKTEYGKYLPYEYFTVESSLLIYCIAYEDDALSYGLKAKFNTLLGLTSTMQAFSEYGKAHGGTGVVGASLLDFGDYNGKRVCLVITGTH